MCSWRTLFIIGALTGHVHTTPTSPTPTTTGAPSHEPAVPSVQSTVPQTLTLTAWSADELETFIFSSASSSHPLYIKAFANVSDVYVLSATLNIVAGADVKIVGCSVEQRGHVGISVLALSGGHVRRVVEVASGATLTLWSIALIDGYHTQQGAAMYSFGNVFLGNVVVANNTCIASNAWISGGILANFGGSYTLQHCEIVSNRVTQGTLQNGISGGVVLFGDSTQSVRFSGVTLRNNTVNVTTSGQTIYGAIVSLSATQDNLISMTNLTFESNQVAAGFVNGGLIQIYQGGDFTAARFLARNNHIRAGNDISGGLIQLYECGDFILSEAGLTGNTIKSVSGRFVIYAMHPHWPPYTDTDLRLTRGFKIHQRYNQRRTGRRGSKRNNQLALL